MVGVSIQKLPLLSVMEPRRLEHGLMEHELHLINHPRLAEAESV